MITRTTQYDAMIPDLDAYKRHIRMTSNDLDAELLDKLRAAVASAEHQIGSIITLSDFILSTDFKTKFCLRGPVVSVNYVKVDGYSVAYTVFGDIVTIMDETITGEMVEISYRAGMQDVPYDIRAAILLHATRLFNRPEDSVETLPTAAVNLLRPYRNWKSYDE